MSLSCSYFTPLYDTQKDMRAGFSFDSLFLLTTHIFFCYLCYTVLVTEMFELKCYLFSLGLHSAVSLLMLQTSVTF